MEIYVKEFSKSEFELKIEEIIEKLSDKDCQRVEFLRGMLAVYKEMVENRKGWKKEIRNEYFK